METSFVPEFPHLFLSFCAHELIELVLEPTTEIMMKARISTKELAVKQESVEVKFVAKIVEPRLGAPIMIMTMVRSKTRCLRLKNNGWSYHDVGVRGVPGDVGHGGVRCCLGEVPRGIGPASRSSAFSCRGVVPLFCSGRVFLWHLSTTW